MYRADIDAATNDKRSALAVLTEMRMVFSVQMESEDELGLRESSRNQE